MNANLNHIILLKVDGCKRYTRITDLNKIFADDELKQQCFSHKDSAVIRNVIDNSKVTRAELSLFTWDAVDRTGPDRYDEPDIVYGTRLCYIQPLCKNIALIGEYRWYSEPATTNMPLSSFTYTIKPVDLPDELFGTDKDKVIVRGCVHGPFPAGGYNTKHLTSINAVLKYKTILMKRLRNK